MNPMTWPREHQVALLLGIVLGIVLDFLSGTRTTAFILTLQNWTIGSRFRWGAFGGLVGACAIFTQRLLRT